MTEAGFPHSDTLGSQLGWQLPEAFRSLLRPSSAPGAKTSTVCSSQLDHKDARIHCVVLKEQPETRLTTEPPRHPPGATGLDSEQILWLKQHQECVPSGPNSVLTTPTTPSAIPFHALTSSTRSHEPQVLLHLASIHIYEQPPHKHSLW